MLHCLVEWSGVLQLQTTLGPESSLPQGRINRSAYTCDGGLVLVSLYRDKIYELKN